MKKFCFWFAVEFLAFALVVANGRAYVQGSYFWTFVTDFAIQVNGFIVGAKFAKDATDGKVDKVVTFAGALGGATGSLFAIWLTKMLYGA